MITQSRALTLAEAGLPASLLRREPLLIVGASLLTALSAQLSIHLPWTPVPVTGQTFGVLLCGALLGARRAFLAQALYLIEGACGLPVFAGGAGGAHVFLGPTAGYLMSFPLAAGVTGALAERRWDRSPLSMFLAMLLGSAVIFALGVAWLARFLPPGRLAAAGILPFIPGDVVKAALAAIVFPAAWRRLGRG